MDLTASGLFLVMQCELQSQSMKNKEGQLLGLQNICPEYVS